MWGLLALATVLFACWYIPRRIDRATAKLAETERLKANCIARARERAAACSSLYDMHVDWECNGQ